MIQLTDVRPSGIGRSEFKSVLPAVHYSVSSISEVKSGPFTTSSYTNAASDGLYERFVVSMPQACSFSGSFNNDMADGIVRIGVSVRHARLMTMLPEAARATHYHQQNAVCHEASDVSFSVSEDYHGVNWLPMMLVRQRCCGSSRCRWRTRFFRAKATVSGLKKTAGVGSPFWLSRRIVRLKFASTGCCPIVQTHHLAVIQRLSGYGLPILKLMC